MQYLILKLMPFSTFFSEEMRFDPKSPKKALLVSIEQLIKISQVIMIKKILPSPPSFLR
jgi:hypothetical protein